MEVLLLALPLLLGVLVGPVSCNKKQPFKADLSVNPPTVTEGGGPLIIRMIISREAKPLGDDWPDPEVNITFTLHVKSTAGTAEEDLGFDDVNHSLNISSAKLRGLKPQDADDAIVRHFDVNVTDDDIAEGTEEFTLEIAIVPEELENKFELGSATVTIKDNDKVRVGFSSEYYITHVNETLQLTVQLEGELDCSHPPARNDCFSVTVKIPHKAEPLKVTFGEGDHQKKVHVPVRHFPDSFTATLTAEGDDRIELGRNQATIEVSLTPQQQQELLGLQVELNDTKQELTDVKQELTDMKQELKKLTHGSPHPDDYNEQIDLVEQLYELRERVEGLLDDTGKGVEVSFEEQVYVCNVRDQSVDVNVTISAGCVDRGFTIIVSSSDDTSTTASGVVNVQPQEFNEDTILPISVNISACEIDDVIELSLDVFPKCIRSQVKIASGYAVIYGPDKFPASIEIDVSFDKAEYSVSGDAGSVEVKVVIKPEGVVHSKLNIAVTSQEDTAKAGVDFEAVNKTCYSACTITVKLMDSEADSGADGDKSFSLSLTAGSTVTTNIPQTIITISNSQHNYDDDDNDDTYSDAVPGSTHYLTWLFVSFIVLLIIGAVGYVTYHNRAKCFGGMMSRGGEGPRKYMVLSQTIHET